jgi:tetratricopeptide (TPR) repeat protein
MKMNRRAVRILLVTVTLALATGVPGLASAQPRPKATAEGHYQKGMKAYTLGKFADAIEEFEKAYELRQEPIFLYNIAQSHRQNNSPQRAVFFYRRYLEAEPEAKNRADIEKRIKDMENQLSAKPENLGGGTTPPPAAAPVPVPAPQPAVAPAPPPASSPLIRQPQQPEPGASPGRTLRISGIVVGSVGVASAVTGVFLALHASSLREEATKPGSVYDDDKYQSSQTFRTLGWVTLGAGAAAAVTGGVLYYLGARAASAPAVAVLPFAAPGAGGATLFARF